MDFDQTDDELQFRGHVRAVLESPHIRAELDRIDGCREETDERPLYRLLAAGGLLSATWPVEYGGHARPAVAGVIVLEELVRAGVPDTLYVNGIQTVGQVLLTAGTAEQQSRLLPAMGRGDRFAAVLYTEPDVGSDLASLGTWAAPVDDGFEIVGTKIYSMKTRFADTGLCAARIDDGPSTRSTPSTHSKYAGITLFLIDLHAPGVMVRTVPSITREQFHAVELDRVRVGADSMVGEPGDGWAILTQALSFERTGVEFAARASRWYEMACAGHPPRPEDAGRYGARVEAAGLLARRAANAVGAGRSSPMPTAVAKWYASELAAELAGWAVRRHGSSAPSAVTDAYREGPALTLSGGTSEMMLQLVFRSLLDEDTAQD